MELARLVAHHQRQFATGVAERCSELDERLSVLEQRHRELLSRIERAEVGLTRLEQALPRRKVRIATLREELTLLRNGATPDVQPRVSGADRLGTALIYAGGLVLVWLVLWQLGLALGLR
jgi:predicted nuclease with TOPRIM domain